MGFHGTFRKLYDEVKDSFEYKLEVLSIDVTEKVCDAMQQKGLNRNDLAKALGVSRASVTQFLNEGSNITLKRLLKIAEALDYDITIEMVPRKQRTYRGRITTKYDLTAEHLENVTFLDERQGCQFRTEEVACG